MTARKLQKPILPRLTSRAKHLTIVLSVFAFLGLIGLTASNAATNTISAEAESGTASGNATLAADSAASGNQKVTFGMSATTAPGNLQAITGGDSIALLWDLPPLAAPPKNIEVYRNNTKIATVTPGTGVVRSERLGTRYIDKAVTKGASYQYKLKAIGQNNLASEFSSTVTATHPANTTPVPAVTIDASQASDLTNYLTNSAKPEIEIWYPKISDAVAFPDYTPMQNLRLFMDPANTGVAYVGGNLPAGTVSVNPNWLRDNLEDGGGMFIHEVTHIIQSYPSSPFWLQEGLPDWVRDWLTRERYKHRILTPSSKLENGYSVSAHMLRWAELKYDPGIVRKLNLAAHAGNYSDSMFSNLTGKSPEQMFAESKNQHYGPSGQIKNGDGKCVDIEGGTKVTGAKLQLLGCNNANAQKWQIVYQDAGVNGDTKKIFYLMNTAVGAADGMCVDVQSSGTAAGTITHSWNCSFDDINDAQIWTKGGNGSLVNVHSGKCLAPAGNGNADGTQLVIADCNGSASQNWTLPT